MENFVICFILNGPTLKSILISVFIVLRNYIGYFRAFCWVMIRCFLIFHQFWVLTALKTASLLGKLFDFSLFPYLKNGNISNCPSS